MKPRALCPHEDQHRITCKPVCYAGAKPHQLQLKQQGVACLAWNPVHMVLAMTGTEVRAGSRGSDTGTLLIFAPP